MELDSRQAAALDSGGQVPVEQTGGPPQLPPAAYNVATMPGFRFQPTEEELVGFYLRSMVMGNRLEVDLINVLNLYHYDPWELPAMAFMQDEREWLFFCPRDKKYPNGARPNRVTASGYWKATGTDRPVRRAHDARCIGLKKTLVFYTGKAPRGRKTEWIMNEYRLLHGQPSSSTSCQTLQNFHLTNSITANPAHDQRPELALCRIYKRPFQMNLIDTTNRLSADKSIMDIDSPPGTRTPYPPSPSPKRVKLTHSNGSIQDTETGVTGLSTSTNHKSRNMNIVKLEGDLASNVMRYKDPALTAPAAGDNLSAQLMPELANWSDYVAGVQSVSTGNSLLHRQVSGRCPTFAGIDRLLKASMWSPLVPLQNTLDSSGALCKVDCMDSFGDGNEPSNLNLLSSQFGVCSYDKLGCKDTIDSILFA